MDPPCGGAGHYRREKGIIPTGAFIGTLHNVEALDVLPYHDMGKAKYHNLGIPYPLEKVKPLGKEEALAARKMIVQGIREEKEARLKGYVRA